MLHAPTITVSMYKGFFQWARPFSTSGFVVQQELEVIVAKRSCVTSDPKLRIL
jgi:hypothetical protein